MNDINPLLATKEEYESHQAAYLICDLEPQEKITDQHVKDIYDRIVRDIEPCRTLTSDVESKKIWFSRQSLRRWCQSLTHGLRPVFLFSDSDKTQSNPVVIDPKTVKNPRKRYLGLAQLK